MPAAATASCVSLPAPAPAMIIPLNHKHFIQRETRLDQGIDPEGDWVLEYSLGSVCGGSIYQGCVKTLCSDVNDRRHLPPSLLTMSEEDHHRW